VEIASCTIKSGVPHNFDHYCYSQRRGYMWTATSRSANFAVVTNESRVHREGLFTSLSQLLLLLMTNNIQRSSYNCHRHLLDILNTWQLLLASLPQSWLVEDRQMEPSPETRYTAMAHHSLHYHSVGHGTLAYGGCAIIIIVPSRRE